MLLSRAFAGCRRVFCSRFCSEEMSELMNMNSSIIHVRHKSGWSRRRRSRRGEVIELQVDKESGEFEAIALKRLEETIHSIQLKRAQPVWLPFRPGMSYWVPPPAKLDKLLQAAITGGGHINEDDLHAFSTARRGWPSHSFYIEDDSTDIVETIAETSEKSEEEEG